MNGERYFFVSYFHSTGFGSCYLANFKGNVPCFQNTVEAKSREPVVILYIHEFSTQKDWLDAQGLGCPGCTTGKR